MIIISISHGWISWSSPHGVVGGVGVPRRHHPHQRADDGVLGELHVVRRQVEQRRLVHVLHAHVHDGDVLEGPAVAEGRVQVRVGALHLQGVAGLALEVQRLEDEHNEPSSSSHDTLFDLKVDETAADV